MQQLWGRKQMTLMQVRIHSSRVNQETLTPLPVGSRMISVMALFERAAANCELFETGRERCPSTYAPNSSHPDTAKSSRRDAKADCPIPGLHPVANARSPRRPGAHPATVTGPMPVHPQLDPSACACLSSTSAHQGDCLYDHRQC